MTEPYRWTLDERNRQYVIWQGARQHQTVPINRRNPAHTPTYMDRYVGLLNGER